MMQKDKQAQFSRSGLPLICKVCGDAARGFNFDVMTCLSCKAFFRRNAYRLLKIRRCQHKNYCKITKETRSYCPTCRLSKCYVLGMNPNLIQKIVPNSDVYTMLITKEPNQVLLPTPRPRNILQNDRSMLSYDEWNLLSNIIHLYDKHNMINEFKHMLEEKSVLPAKLRLKPADTIDLISKPMKHISLIIKHVPHIRGLSKNTYRTITLNNVITVSFLDAYFVARETNQFNNTDFMIATSVIFGTDHMMECAKSSEHLELNGNLIKVMLFSLIFSSNCSIVTFNNQQDLNLISNTSELIHIQNMYLTMLWKYLIYLYGHVQAVSRFSSMVKSILDILNRLNQLSENKTVEILGSTSIEHTEHSLMMQD